MICSMDDIWSFLDSKSGSLLAWRDDYAFWAKNRFQKDAGKIMLISSEKGALKDIFFDDNIRHNNPNIIDARERISKHPVAFSQTKNRYLFPVDSYAAIMNENYFVELLNSQPQ